MQTLNTASDLCAPIFMPLLSFYLPHCCIKMLDEQKTAEKEHEHQSERASWVKSLNWTLLHFTDSSLLKYDILYDNTYIEVIFFPNFQT